MARWRHQREGQRPRGHGHGPFQALWYAAQRDEPWSTMTDLSSAGPTRPRLWLMSCVYFDTESYSELRRKILAVLEVASFTQFEVKLVVVEDTGGMDPQADLLKQHADTTVLVAP